MKQSQIESKCLCYRIEQGLLETEVAEASAEAFVAEINEINKWEIVAHVIRWFNFLLKEHDNNCSFNKRKWTRFIRSKCPRIQIRLLEPITMVMWSYNMLCIDEHIGTMDDISYWAPEET